MLLSLKGTDFEFPTGESDGGLYFTYLEYSTLARAELPWRLTLTSKVKLHSHVVLGPWAGFLLSAESVNPDVGSGSVRSAIKTFDFGVTGGFGVVAEPVWWGALELSARYVFGIPQIGDPNDELDRDDAKHRTISVMVGFRCCAYRKRTPPAQQGREPYETDPKSPVEIEREVPVGPEPRAPNALGAPDEPEPGDDSDDAEPVDGDRANGVQ